MIQQVWKKGKKNLIFGCMFVSLEKVILPSPPLLLIDVKGQQLPHHSLLYLLSDVDEPLPSIRIPDKSRRRAEEQQQATWAWIWQPKPLMLLLGSASWFPLPHDRSSATATPKYQWPWRRPTWSWWPSRSLPKETRMSISCKCRNRRTSYWFRTSSDMHSRRKRLIE